MRSLHTPQQETNSAYNPGVTFQGGQFLAQGISQAGNAIFAGLASYAAAQEEQKTRAREFKSLLEFADATGIASKDQLIDKDLDTVRGIVRGGEAKRAQQEQQRKAQMEQAQFEELKKYRQSELSRNLGNDAWRMMGDVVGWQRGADAERRAEGDFALRQRQDADARAARESAQREKQAVDKDVAGFWNYVAPRVTAPAGMGPTVPLDMAAIEGMSQFPRTRQDPNLDNLVGALGRMQPKPAWSPSVQVVDGVRFGTTSPSSAQVLPGAPPPTAPLPIVPGFTPVPTGEPGRVQWLKTAAPNGTEPDRETLGRIAQLEELLRQKGGQDFAFDYNNTAGYSTSRFWDDGKSAKAELARLRGMTGGVPASGPAAAAAPDLKPGDERKGYIYQGGDPSKPESWRKK